MEDKQSKLDLDWELKQNPTQVFDHKGTTVHIYGELNVKVLAEFLLHYSDIEIGRNIIEVGGEEQYIAKLKENYFKKHGKELDLDKEKCYYVDGFDIVGFDEE